MTSFEPLPRQTLTDDLAQRLRRLIQERGYAAGHRLPAIAEMAARFGVGQPTLREALKQLQTVGLVDIRHGSGVYVKNASTLLVTNPIHAEPATKKLLVDLIEARMPVELTAVRLAARNASRAGLAEMRRLLAEAERNLDDSTVLSAVNMQFHLAIASASGNTVLFEILKGLSGLFQREQRLILDIYGSRRRDHQEHAGILRALTARDDTLAVRRMRAHLEGVRTVLEQWEPAAAPVG